MADTKNNTGKDNSGNWNSGNRNSGDWNSGDWNSGYRNSGDWNSGNWNSGNWNSGNWNSGIFNTDETYMRAFNKPTTIKLSQFIGSDAYPDFLDMNPCVWVESSIMTAEEKKENPTYETTGGYIKVLSYKDAWTVWKRKCTPENWQKVLALPNFDPQIFEEITGIKVEDNPEAKQKAKQLREKADELLKQATELEQSL